MIGWWAEIHGIVESRTAGTEHTDCTEHAESLNAAQWARIEALLPPRTKERLMEARYSSLPCAEPPARR